MKETNTRKKMTRNARRLRLKTARRNSAKKGEKRNTRMMPEKSSDKKVDGNLLQTPLVRMVDGRPLGRSCFFWLGAVKDG